ncbi:hypothetical protein SDRG_09973 [Saprolegnia diclina VS20]|uniref:Protein YIPF n=1 Tax=Saprolegnia diclina (strain VS20) TaxID=1156394 RepID=T0QBY2_SAPDV|nr:hypothetical protein SDRG_09973 [Saprolegnia diclina VS20]EQC32221.1 hypothetical protein SDRG_09973 [Saprolegnia diclina VS20]|eukprot:XP_008614162.1 hypothetical protein SDRG_09973 [Saprolegnia diclina VS20]
MMEPAPDVKAAAAAMNDRSHGLHFDVTVGDDDLEDGTMSPKAKDTLLHGNGKDGRPALGLCGCFTLGFYQPYFNVDTIDIQVRLTRALIPFKKDPSFKDLALANPDAYGPFWLSATLIFCMASCSNIASWLDYEGDDPSKWSYDFSYVATSMTMVGIYLLGLPLALWSVGKYISVPLPLSFLVCLYGYSLSIFIPTMFVCTAPSDAADWVMMLFAMAWSLLFLLTNMWGYIVEYLPKEKLLPLLSFIGTTHLVWVVLLKLLFF